MDDQGPVLGTQTVRPRYQTSRRNRGPFSRRGDPWDVSGLYVAILSVTYTIIHSMITKMENQGSEDTGGIISITVSLQAKTRIQCGVFYGEVETSNNGRLILISTWKSSGKVIRYSNRGLYNVSIRHYVTDSASPGVLVPSKTVEEVPLHPGDQPQIHTLGCEHLVHKIFGDLSRPCPTPRHPSFPFRYGSCRQESFLLGDREDPTLLRLYELNGGSSTNYKRSL